MSIKADKDVIDLDDGPFAGEGRGGLLKRNRVVVLQIITLKT